MNQEIASKGSVLGGALLVAGCSIGAAMLGLPVLSASVGFIPTALLFVLVWLFMATTGLLLLEVNLWYKDETNIVSMAERTLGKWGKVAAWVLFFYLFFSIMVAYTQGAGSLFADFFSDYTGIVLPDWVGSLGIALLFGGLIYLGTATVDWFNRFLMVGLVATYLMLLFVGTPHVQPQLLLQHDWSVAPLLIPSMVISFGFHNLVASLSTYLHHDAKALKKTILIGSATPLLIYLLWEAVILGVCTACGTFHEALNSGEMAAQMLRRLEGSTLFATATQYFSYFAIITSFLAVAFSFVDFLADGLHIPKNPTGKFWLCVLTLAPPFFFALFYPKVFLLAIQYAGGFGAVTLFGIMPALMVWQGRYLAPEKGREVVVPGGKVVLALVILFSFFTISLQLSQG